MLSFKQYAVYVQDILKKSEFLSYVDDANIIICAGKMKNVVPCKDGWCSDNPDVNEDGEEVYTIGGKKVADAYGLPRWNDYLIMIRAADSGFRVKGSNDKNSSLINYALAIETWVRLDSPNEDQEFSTHIKRDANLIKLIEDVYKTLSNNTLNGILDNSTPSFFSDYVQLRSDSSVDGAGFLWIGNHTPTKKLKIRF